ncbi:MAG: guanylate kinase [Microvirgula sp.]|uniref:Guanylate kinase n=1 Tax=Microvirgula aerodenitrificans TaxID=57480 RepID=A0A2S0P7V2_9NEIS|nr:MULTISPECIES: guanylate kinase [Microvirgula]AVY93367.1 guanylate kinase [Microvirgula aerodenitrificans]RAS19878.1 guanylate kinase [Microvirgula sp. AG722]
MQSGNIFIVTAPSGAGKTTLVAALLAADKQVQLSVSYTTRAPRDGETHGRHYHFVDRATFESMIDRGDFLEYAEVYGNYYGTSETWIREQLSTGRDILLEIDWQGAQQVRRTFPEAIGIFILPPSVEVLEHRLRGRGKDDEATMQKRLAAARSEIDHVAEFDYVVVNEELDEAVRDLVSVVRAERLTQLQQMERRGRQIAAMQSLD